MPNTLYDIAVEIQRARGLKVVKKKKKSGVVEGFIMYPTSIWPPYCTCEKFDKRIGCRHIYKLLLDKGWSEKDIYVLPRASSDAPGQSSLEVSVNECPVCLEKVSDVINSWSCHKCRNLMHRECAKRWITRDKSCPVCREIILA